MSIKKNVDIKALSFEEAMKELQEIVSCLERGSVTLEDSICSYERGELLRLHCDKILKNAEHRVEKIITNSKDGSLSSLDIT